MIRRARPLLGTIVSIAADAALDAVFETIERVHVLMSAQIPASDIGRINAEAHRQAVPVHGWTFRVLETALHVSQRTDGAFDVVVPGTGARHTDIVLEDGSVRLRRPARLDVSGIAKGFAVDLAVETLERHGARHGSVNAGGDLRFVGDTERSVCVRVPGNDGRTLQLPSLPYGAYATSCGDFGATLHDCRNGSSRVLDWSVTVAAATCVIADALTKAVALLGPRSDLLRVFDATAFAVDVDGRLHAPAG